MGEKRRKLNFNESMVAKLMSASWNTYAQASGNQKIDVTELLHLMNRLKEEGKKVSYTAVFVKAIAVAMANTEHKENILLNCRIEGDEIIFYDKVNVGIGVQTPTGLMSIVIHDCIHKTLFEISDEVKNKIVRANQGKLTMDDITGSTVTISNLCKTGSQVFSSVITNDQAIIMGFGSIYKDVMVKDNEIVICDVMHVMQNCNHTACNGMRSAIMFDDVCYALKHPQLLLA